MGIFLASPWLDLALLYVTKGVIPMYRLGNAFNHSLALDQ